MANAGDFYARDGEPIRPKLKKLVDFVLSISKLTVAGPGRIHQYHDGRAVVMEPVAVPFGGSFRVRRTAALEVEIGDGLVNGRVPTISGRTIDGLDAEGRPHKLGRPKLKLDAPGDRLRSYVAIRGVVDPGTGEMDAEDKGAVTVVHVPAVVDEGEFVGLRLVAEVVWGDRRRVVRVRRIVYFDQEYRYLEGRDGGKGRVQFAPAG